METTGQKTEAQDQQNGTSAHREQSCQYCDYVTSQPSALTKHALTHTGGGGGVGNLECKLCSYQCRNEPELRRHVQAHKMYKPFCCPHCQYRSARKYNLQIHIRSHTGEKPFSCPYCPFRSSNRSNLKSHIYTHSVKNPHL